MKRLTKSEKQLELARQWAWVCDALTSKQFFKAECNWNITYESKIREVRKITKSGKVLARLEALECILNTPTTISLEVIQGERLTTGICRAKLSLVG